LTLPVETEPLDFVLSLLQAGQIKEAVPFLKSIVRSEPDNVQALYTREGKVVVVQHRAISDPETGGRYTIKRYESKKVVTEDGNWRHQLITLHPDSDQPEFKPLVIELNDGDDEFSVVAEMLMVLEAS
jgi:hypothetical protein